MNVAGGFQRTISATAESGKEVKIASGDYRDRLLVINGRHAGTLIYPGGADAGNHNAATAFSHAFYSGPGDTINAGLKWALDIATDVYIQADVETGDLYMTNYTGADVTITGMVLASPVLGPRFPVLR